MWKVEIYRFPYRSMDLPDAVTFSVYSNLKWNKNKEWKKEFEQMQLSERRKTIDVVVLLSNCGFFQVSQRGFPSIHSCLNFFFLLFSITTTTTSYSFVLGGNTTVLVAGLPACLPVCLLVYLFAYLIGFLQKFQKILFELTKAVWICASQILCDAR